MAFLYMSYVLKDSHPVQEAEIPISAVTALLSARKDDLGAEYEYAGEDPGEKHTAYVWEQKGTKISQIRLVHRLGDESWFITVGALTEAGCERIGGVLASELSFYTATELVEEARKATADNVGWITLMAHGSNGRFDPGVVEVIELHLRSKLRSCRREAAMAVALVRWPQLLPALRTARQSERDAGIRANLDLAILICQDTASASVE